MSFSKLFYLVPFMVLSFIFSNCPDGTDVCLSLNNGSLEYDSTADIAGFQFNHNGCVTGASGGDATAAGFTISASGTVVLAFSFTGAVIPAGVGTLVDLDGDVNEGCLSEFIFSGPGGDALEVAFSVEPVLGCTDIEACNYDSSANTDDGSCEYPEENFDCEGNCVVAEDCAGVCGGDAVEDCTGLCGGDAQLDECGECGGDGSSCAECESDPATWQKRGSVDGERQSELGLNLWAAAHGSLGSSPRGVIATLRSVDPP
mgnify:CR=1 FL=1